LTQDEIMKMAHEAGLHIATDVNWMPIIGLEYAEKLIALARAEEREACAKAVLAIANDDAGNPYKQAMRIGAEAIRSRGQA
jgi:hypothetical protein